MRSTVYLYRAAPKPCRWERYANLLWYLMKCGKVLVLWLLSTRLFLLTKFHARTSLQESSAAVQKMGRRSTTVFMCNKQRDHLPIVGMCQQNQYFHNSQKSVKDTTYDCQHSIVCPQYNISWRLECAVSKGSHKTKKHNLPQQNRRTVNVLIQPLLQPQNQRRLKRNWPADLLEG
jgi:hypothetical protein